VRGSALLHEQTRRDVSLKQMLATLEISPPQRVRGTAIFLTADPNAAPTALMHNLKHNQVLHERIILVSIRTAPTPRVNDADRVTIEAVRDDIQIVTLSFGFMETPNVIRGSRLPRAGPCLRHHENLVLPQPPRYGANRKERHAPLARPALHLTRAKFLKRDGVLPHPDGARWNWARRWRSKPVAQTRAPRTAATCADADLV
jgi:hypothetical protein